jgi:hypothetical protein
MEARVLHIEEKLKTRMPGLTGPSNFKLRDGGPFDPRNLLKDPNFSLYCLDFENRQALFVETPPECDLSQAPFLYQTQYEAARRLIQIPYATLHRLAVEVEIDPSKLALIYSVGRCGSTLTSRAFNALEGVDSLSEPDIFTQMYYRWEEEGGESEENAALLKSCVALQCAPGRMKGASAWALKFRSDVTPMGPIFYSAFPEAKVVFLYRHPEPWARSNWRYMQVFFPDVAGSDVTQPAPESNGRSILHLMAKWWLAPMQSCLEMQQIGIPMFVARYEELNASPRDVLSAMFAYCGLDIKTGRNLDAVLEQDAQEGTELSRASLDRAPTQLTAEHLKIFRRIIEDIAPGWTADAILPGTYFPGL